MIQMRIIIITI